MGYYTAYELRVQCDDENKTKKISNEIDKYYAYIKRDQKMCNLGKYVFEEEALFARWYAETILFGEYRYPKDKPFILPDRETAIKEYVDRKVQRL